MKKTTFIALAAVILASCSTSNEVASNNRIQKRKYTKGWHIKKSTNLKKSKGEDTDESGENSQEKKKKQKEINFILPVKQMQVNTDDANQQELKVVEYSEVNTNEVVENPTFDRAADVAKEAKGDLSLKEKLVVKSAVKKAEKTIEKHIAQNELAQQKVMSTQEEANSSLFNDTDLILLYVLAIFIPFLAVGIVTNWDIGMVLLNILLCLLCGLPGIIHAIIVVKNNA